MKRIKVPLPPVDEKKKVIEDVDKDRRFAIDAAIVRTMKSRKQMQHQQLVLEVVSQLTRMFKVGGGVEVGGWADPLRCRKTCTPRTHTHTHTHKTHTHTRSLTSS